MVAARVGDRSVSIRHRKSKPPQEEALWCLRLAQQIPAFCRAPAHWYVNDRAIAIARSFMYG